MSGTSYDFEMFTCRFVQILNHQHVTSEVGKGCKNVLKINQVKNALVNTVFYPDT